MATSPILVTGATGTVGSEVVKLLLEGGHHVRALVRDPVKAARLGDAVEIVVADLSRPETLPPAFAGVDAAFVASNGLDIAALEANAFDAAKRAGVKHIVKLSGRHLDADFMQGTSLGHNQNASEERLRQLGIAWTIVRPGFFASNFLLFIDRAQGVLPWALVDRIKVRRQVPSTGQSQFFSIDLRDSLAARFPLLEFDEVTVLDGREVANTNRVSIRGAVRIPGTKPWARNLTFGDMLDLANGFEPYAMSDRILITRRSLATGRVEIVRVDARDSSSRSLVMSPLDELFVPDARVSNPTYSVTISGAIFLPGTKLFGAGMTLADLIDLSGGFRPEAQYVELARVQRGADYSDTTAVVQRFSIGERDAGASWGKVLLDRGDNVVARSSPGFRNVGAVSVVGAFRFPGSYVIQSNAERLSSVINRAGGLLPIAYRHSLRVTRNGRPVPVRIEGIVAGKENDDLLVVDGDQIEIDIQSQIVVVGGAVERQVSVPYRKEWRLRNYLDAAGGLTDSANTRSIVVTYASGSVRREKKYYNLFTVSPDIEPGATISVGTKLAGSGIDWGRILSVAAQATLTLSSLFLSYFALRK